MTRAERYALAARLHSEGTPRPTIARALGMTSPGVQYLLDHPPGSAYAGARERKGQAWRLHAKGWSQAQIAELLGVDPSTISKMLAVPR